MSYSGPRVAIHSGNNPHKKSIQDKATSDALNKKTLDTIKEIHVRLTSLVFYGKPSIFIIPGMWRLAAQTKRRKEDGMKENRRRYSNNITLPHCDYAWQWRGFLSFLWPCICMGIDGGHLVVELPMSTKGHLEERTVQMPRKEDAQLYDCVERSYVHEKTLAWRIRASSCSS